MPKNESERSSKQTIVCRILATITVMLLVVPVWGADKTKDEETIGNATTVLQAMIEGNSVPADVLARADCVIVLPSVKKFGLGIGGTGGRGPMSCRGGENFSGKWSAPAMLTIGGASVGLQVGGTATDFVLLVMSQKGVDAILQGKTKLGTDATAAAGPGATTAGEAGGTDVFTYGRASGLFAGVSLGGATLDADKDANKRLYGKPVTAQEIVLGNAVKATEAGAAFDSLLNSKVAKHSS